MRKQGGHLWYTNGTPEEVTGRLPGGTLRNTVLQHCAKKKKGHKNILLAQVLMQAKAEKLL